MGRYDDVMMEKRVRVAVEVENAFQDIESESKRKLNLISDEEEDERRKIFFK